MPARVRSREQAYERAVHHIRSWGAVGFETSQRLAAASPESEFHFLVWFVPELNADARLGLARQVDPAAVPGEVAPVVFVRASTSAIRELAMNGAVSRVVLAGRDSDVRVAEVPQPRASTAQNYPLPNSALNHRSNEVFTALGYDGTGERVGIVEARGEASMGCLVASPHEALTNASVSYQRSSGAVCVADTDCGFCEEQFHVDDSGNPIAANGRCIDFGGQSYCVSEHASMVVSRIASTHRCHAEVDEPYSGDLFPGVPSYWFSTPVFDVVCVEGDYNAAGASLYVTNNFTGSAGLPSGSAAELEAAYAYLSTAGGGTPIVNESYGALSFREPSAHAVLADWFGRYRNMLFVQAAGNGEPTSSDLRTYCLSFNGLCVGATEVLPLGYTGPSPVEPDLTDLTFAFFSLWENYSFESDPLFELEKPDLVGDGFWSHVMDLSDTSDMEEWKLAHGTSFSAPAVTGLLAQLRHSCRNTSRESDFDESHELRAAVMFSQWDSTMYRLETDKANPEIAEGTWPTVCPDSLFGPDSGPVYPTADSRLACDYKAGVGQLDARRLARFCRATENPWPDPEGPDEVESASGTISPEGGAPVPPGLFDPEDALGYLDNRSMPEPSGGGSGPAPVPEGAATRTGAGMGLTMETLAKLAPPGERAQPGTRVRASFAYMSCPGGAPAFDQSVVRWSDIGGGYPLPAQPPPIADLQPAVDFNLALVGVRPDDSEELVYASEALYDTEEGFDVVVPHDGFKTLEIRVIKPDNYIGCGGRAEPFALSHGVWWAPAP